MRSLTKLLTKRWIWSLILWNFIHPHLYAQNVTYIWFILSSTTSVSVVWQEWVLPSSTVCWLYICVCVCGQNASRPSDRHDKPCWLPMSYRLPSHHIYVCICTHIYRNCAPDGGIIQRMSTLWHFPQPNEWLFFCVH